MSVAAAERKEPWYLNPTWQKRALWLLLVVCAVEGYIAVFRRENDFVFHRNTGLAFLEGNPYGAQSPGDWYPMGRIMFNAALAALPYYASRAVCFAAALLAFPVCFEIWRCMALRGDALRGEVPGWLDERVTLAAGVGAAALLGPYIIRDFDECGLQTLLLLFLTLGAWAVMLGKNWQAGFWLALAATFKLTPIICLPFLLWKRRFAAAAWMGLFLVGWNLAPALFLGWDATIAGNQQFFARIRQTTHVVDPAFNGVEPPKPHNQSINGALARYLESYPPGHPLHIDHPAFMQFGSMAPENANLAVKGCLLALAGVLAWRFRRRWPAVKDWPSESSSSLRLADHRRKGIEADPAPEWAVVFMLCALIAPVCWKQHMVVYVPAAFLVLRDLLKHPGQGMKRWWVVGAMAVVAFGARHGFVGREMSIVLLSYKLDFAAAMALLAMTTMLPYYSGTAVKKPSESSTTFAPMCRAA